MGFAGSESLYCAGIGSGPTRRLSPRSREEKRCGHALLPPLEGIIAKRSHSSYEPRKRTGLWQKYRLNLLGVWAAGNLARPVEGDWHRRRSAWVIISADRQKRDQCLVSHPGNHSSRCIRFRFIAAHIRRHSAFTAHNPRRLKDLNPSTCLIQPNTGSGMVLRRR